MKNYQTILINRLAHQVKNDLTTMRLALFNLSHLLIDERKFNRLSEKSDDFINAIKTPLDHSIETISNLLLITRSDKSYFKTANLVRVLFEIITQCPAHDRFNISIPEKDIEIFTELQSLRIFLDMLLSDLATTLKNGTEFIRVQLSEKNDRCVEFSGYFQIPNFFPLLHLENDLKIKSVDSIKPFLLRQLMENLNISVETKQKKNGLTIIGICFNQEDGEIK